MLQKGAHYSRFSTYVLHQDRHDELGLSLGSLQTPMMLGHWLDAPALDQCHRSHRRSSHCPVYTHPRFRCHHGGGMLSRGHLSFTISANASPAKTQWHHLRHLPLERVFAFESDELQLTQPRKSREARNPEFQRLVRAPFASDADSSELSRSRDTLESFESEHPMV